MGSAQVERATRPGEPGLQSGRIPSLDAKLSPQRVKRIDDARRLRMDPFEGLQRTAVDVVRRRL